jgi:hypothetical protein
LWRAKNRWIERSDVSTPNPSAIRALKASRVRSVSFATSASSQAACGSSGERLLPPRFRGLMPPVRAWSCVHRIADAALTLNRSAALRHDKPAATSATTLARRSSERALPIVASESEASGTHVKAAAGIPSAITFDSAQQPNALGAASIAQARAPTKAVPPTKMPPTSSPPESFGKGITPTLNMQL